MRLNFEVKMGEIIFECKLFGGSSGEIQWLSFLSSTKSTDLKKVDSPGCILYFEDDFVNLNIFSSQSNSFSEQFMVRIIVLYIYFRNTLSIKAEFSFILLPILSNS